MVGWENLQRKGFFEDYIIVILYTGLYRDGSIEQHPQSVTIVRAYTSLEIKLALRNQVALHRPYSTLITQCESKTD